MLTACRRAWERSRQVGRTFYVPAHHIECFDGGGADGKT